MMTRTMVEATTAADMTGRAGSFVPLVEAARRTGLADSAAGMAAYCGVVGVPVYEVGGEVRVDVDRFIGDGVEVEVGEVTVLEVGVLR